MTGMQNLDDAALDRIIEQITRNVLVMIEESSSAPSHPGPALSPRNFLERLQPVVHAGADRIGTTLGAAPTDGQLGHMIDHTLLKPDATQDQIAQLCFEARKYSFASVCVNPATSACAPSCSREARWWSAPSSVSRWAPRPPK